MQTHDISTVTPKLMELSKLCEKAATIDPALYTKYDVKRGLRDINGKGVLVGLTEISDVCSTKEENGKYNRKYDYPAIFRIDRITDYKILEQTFSLPYATRFQEGEFRKRVQFMYPGQLQRIRLRYTGTSVEAVLDRLPTAKVISQDEKGSIIEAEVYGNGIVMWLLSQGNRIEVLAPQALRDEMKKILTEILEQYKDETEV